MAFITRFGSALLLASTLLVAPAGAQTHSVSAPTTSVQLPRLSGRWVRIVLLDGTTIYGSVKTQDASNITLTGKPPVKLSEIQTVEATDRTLDGGLKGFAAGAAVGLAATKGQSKATPIVTGLVGWYLGLFFDGSRGNFETVYRAPQVTIVPAASLHSIGVTGSVRW